jgi:glutamine synthetase
MGEGGCQTGPEQHQADTPRALDVWERKETKKLFADMEVLSAVELEARHEIELHSYTLKIQIESRVAGDLAQNHIIPRPSPIRTA